MTAAQRLYSELIVPIEDRMKRTVVRIVRNPEDAADTFQNVLAAIWKNLERIHRHPNPHAYILSICINASYDTLRIRSRLFDRHVHLDEFIDLQLSSDVEPPDAHAITREREATIASAIASLPPNQGLAVFLRLVEGESFRTIAETIGCREATARSHVSKGRAGLRELLVDLL